MLCQNCGKYDATTHIKRVVNGEAAESHLCSKCAAELGYNDFFGDFGLNISDLFTSFFGDNPHSLTGGRVERCPGCGCSFEDIIKTGKVGCAGCYNKFYDRLLPSIQRIHGRTKHSGKTPEASAAQQAPANEPPAPENKLEQLNSQMQKAVSEQNFELAAQLRDQIKQLKEEN